MFIGDCNFPQKQVKNKQMRTVQELTQEELQELRSRWYHQHLDDGSLNEVMNREVESEEDISMDIVIAYYEDTSFVEEDFWVNL